MNVERITLALDSELAAALRAAARAEMRRPHDQARYLLRTILLGEQTPATKSNPAEASQAGGGVAEHTAR